MTTVAEIITDAFRQSNLVAVGASETTAQQTEALRYLNRIVDSVFGDEAGEKLIAFPIGRANISRPSGYPGWDTVPDGQWFVPENSQIMLNLESSTDLYLHPDPDDGARFGVNDIAGNLATYPVTVYGNGRLIESGQSKVLNVNGTATTWMYRQDLGNWAVVAPLATSDTFPFPSKFDDFFITMLAMRLNPSYGITIDQQSITVLNRARTQLRARYAQNRPTNSELGLIRMSRLSQTRDEWKNGYWPFDDNSMFNTGWPY